MTRLQIYEVKLEKNKGHSTKLHIGKEDKYVPNCYRCFILKKIEMEKLHEEFEKQRRCREAGLWG